MDIRRKGLAGLCLLLAVSTAAAGGFETEVSVALTHARMAAGGDSLAVTRVHLRHVINCLVGADGAAFDAKAGNPCAGKGAGALMDGSKAQALVLQGVLADASQALAASSLKRAQQQTARVVQELEQLLTPATGR